jgi:hypothetical protein
VIEKLLGFLFLGVLLALGYESGIELVYQRFFPAARFFQVYWYVPLILVPALLLALLAWGLGFYRRGSTRKADLAVSAILAVIVLLTVPASYTCGGTGCF